MATTSMRPQASARSTAPKSASATAESAPSTTIANLNLSYQSAMNASKVSRSPVIKSAL